MATVYLARDLQHGRQVALKVLRPEISDALGGGARFAREIAIAARLSHAHILPLYDSGTLDRPGATPVVFYTMPYVDGRSLRDRLHEQSPLPVAEALAIAAQVAAALDYAHRQGIIHRDIKPENILLAEGSALVADFGIARALEDAGAARLTETGLALGTPAYMSPEQASASGKLDGRSDVYALGCVLYEMLAGEPPFTGTTAQAVMARHAMDPVPSLRTVNPAVSPTLGRVVRRALAKVPSDRYPTAGAFAHALAAPGAIAAEPAVGGRRRKIGAALALSAAALALALALAVALYARRAPTPAPDPAVVAVAPFRVDAANPRLAYLREGLVDLLATRLGGTLAVRPLDSRTLLKAWRGSTRGTGDVPPGRALAVAGRLGAGQLIEGRVAGGGSRVTLWATLREVPGGRERSRRSLEGSADSVTALIDRLAAHLLARAAGEPEERLPALAATSTDALRAYLDGWALVRRGSLEGALKQFQRALAVDSTFALAALGATRMLVDGPFDRSDPEAQLAWRLRDRLTLGDRAYLVAMVGPRYPESSGLLQRRQAVQRLVRLSPENADGWNMYTFAMCFDRRGMTITPDQCRAASRRASALDSTNAMTLGIANDFASLFDDTASVRRTLRLFMRLDSVSSNSQWRQWRTARDAGRQHQRPPTRPERQHGVHRRDREPGAGLGDERILPERGPGTGRHRGCLAADDGHRADRQPALQRGRHAIHDRSRARPRDRSAPAVRAGRLVQGPERALRRRRSRAGGRRGRRVGARAGLAGDERLLSRAVRGGGMGARSGPARHRPPCAGGHGALPRLARGPRAGTRRPAGLGLDRRRPDRRARERFLGRRAAPVSSTRRWWTGRTSRVSRGTMAT